MTARVEYVVTAPDGREWRFLIDIERASKPPPSRTRRSTLPILPAFPAWTELGCAQCAVCPLDAATHTHCPAAVDLAPIVAAFNGLASFERVDVRVISDEREYRKTTDLQELLRTLVGLVMSTSGCPVLSKFRPMGRLHLPFSTLEETLFRAVALHLMRAYFDHTDGERHCFDLDELRDFYARLTTLNTQFSARVRTVAKNDANMNGIVQLFTIGTLVKDELTDRLDGLRALVNA